MGVISFLLEWDHNDRLEKAKDTSHIFDKDERIAKIAKCTLRCVVCHRLKTHKHGFMQKWMILNQVHGKRCARDSNQGKSDWISKDPKINAQDPMSVCSKMKWWRCQEAQTQKNVTPRRNKVCCSWWHMISITRIETKRWKANGIGSTHWSPMCDVLCVTSAKLCCLKTTPIFWVVLDFNGYQLKPVSERTVEGKPTTVCTRRSQQCGWTVATRTFESCIPEIWMNESCIRGWSDFFCAFTRVRDSWVAKIPGFVLPERESRKRNSQKILSIIY